jgi:hypothetical protein
MQQMIKRFFWIGLLTFGLPNVHAFSLLGPIANGPDAWQVNTIGYAIDGDLGAPKNLGEEYRRNTPVMYYAYNANFLDYFGSNGVVAIDGAFTNLNGVLTNGVDSYNYTNQSPLPFPFDTRQVNATAQTLGLLDLRSEMLHAMMEQLGLADSVRYTWALHDRFTVPGDTNPCPADLIYLVIQRNFDPITLQPTNFVDNTLYTYTIFDNCGQGPPPESDAVEFPLTGSPVASARSTGLGQFYTGLTWDDVGGLRYLLSTNNINTESPPPGTLATSTNFNAEISITTSNLINLTLASLTNGPAALQTLFPNLLITSVTTNANGTFTYSFGNLITNSFSTNTPVQILTTNVAPVIGAPVGSPNVTNVTTGKSFTTNLVSGDYFTFPTNSCGFNIVQTLSNLVTISTNLLVTGTNSAGHFFSTSLIVHSTNHILLVAPCSFSASGTALYEGIEKMQFVRANFDSLLGQFFQPVTNNYSMVAVTNSQTVTQSLQRIVTAPDFVISAADLAAGPDAQPVVNVYSRNVNFDIANVYPTLAGPGTINPSSTIAFDKVGNIFANGPSENTNVFLTDTNQGLVFMWGSFDTSTNIVVYPNGADIQNLENQVLIHISPASPLPNGTKGAAYSQTFTTTGGAFTPPFTWSAPGASPPGLTLSSGGTLFGTPTQSGTFDFVIQMTDSLSRSVQWIYSVTIQ